MTEPAPGAPLGAREIMRRLPHRYPFLLIDRVLRWGEGEAVAIKNVTYNEPFFAGHFPAQPVMPGVLIGEAMAQTAAFIGDGQLGSSAFLAGINLKFERAVVPGDQLVITARLIKRFGKLMKVAAEATVSNAVVATAELTVALGTG